MRKNRSSSITPVDLAAVKSFDDIDWDNLTDEDILEFDFEGFTLLHYVARAGLWGWLPRKLQDKKYWREAQNGDTILMAAFSSQNTSWINPKDLTRGVILKKNQQGQSILTNAIAGRIFGRIPKSLITRDILLLGELEMDRVIHSLARLEQFGQIDKKHLDYEVLALRGSYNESVYHILAVDHSMRRLPKELITREAVTLKTEYGVMPLHAMAEFEWMLIPEDITLEDVCYPMKGSKQTPLHGWARGRGWLDIPDKFLTRESLLLVDRDNATPLSLICYHYHNLFYANFEGDVELKQRVETKMTKILQKLPVSELKKLDMNEAYYLSPLIRAELSKRKAIRTVLKGDTIGLELET